MAYRFYINRFYINYDDKNCHSLDGMAQLGWLDLALLIDMRICIECWCSEFSFSMSYDDNFVVGFCDDNWHNPNWFSLFSWTGLESMMMQSLIISGLACRIFQPWIIIGFGMHMAITLVHFHVPICISIQIMQFLNMCEPYCYQQRKYNIHSESF